MLLLKDLILVQLDLIHFSAGLPEPRLFTEPFDFDGIEAARIIIRRVFRCGFKGNIEFSIPDSHFKKFDQGFPEAFGSDTEILDISDGVFDLDIKTSFTPGFDPAFVVGFAKMKSDPVFPVLQGLREAEVAVAFALINFRKFRENAGDGFAAAKTPGSFPSDATPVSYWRGRTSQDANDFDFAWGGLLFLGLGRKGGEREDQGGEKENGFHGCRCSVRHKAAPT